MMMKMVRLGLASLPTGAFALDAPQATALAYPGDLLGFALAVAFIAGFGLWRRK